MVSQYDIGTVVMLNSLEGKEVYPQYWPSKGSTRYGNITLEMLSESTANGITTRKISIANTEPPKKNSTVQHLQFTAWSDPNSCPDPQEILRLLTAVQKSQQQTGNGTIVFQCSDGVGRSGVAATVMSAIEKLKNEQTVDVLQTVNLIRVKKTLCCFKCGAIHVVLQDNPSIFGFLWRICELLKAIVLWITNGL
ncbi:unnamed protein product, partial [Porites lobata]